MKPTIEYATFDQLDLRVGEVTAAAAPEWSKKLLQLTVDFGSEIGTKTIFSGIRQWYTPEVLLHHKYVFVVNLAERKMGEGVSQGMMIMADVHSASMEQPVLTPVPDEVPVGSVVR